jgi:hypothetical protein
MRVLSGARVDRWRTSSGQTPSSVTRAGVDDDGGLRGEGPGWEGAAVSLPNAHIVNRSAGSEQGADVRPMQGAGDGFAEGRAESRCTLVLLAPSRASWNAMVCPVD